MQKKKSILAIDDNDINRLFVSQALKDIDAQIDVCSSGEEAVQLALKHVYDLFLIDIRMPGIDGYETLRQIRLLASQSKNAIAVALTAEPENFHGEQLLKSGFKAYLGKPISKHQLIDYVCKTLDIGLTDSNHRNATEATTSQQQDLVDMQHALLVTGGNKQHIAEFLEKLLEDIPVQVENIKSAINDADSIKLSEVIHYFLGSLVYCGIKHLPTSLTQLKSAIKEQQPYEHLLELVVTQSEELTSGLPEIIVSLRNL
ncbi:MAG: response regulator [bacterium]